jgi:ABC-type Mn2+/Zn2+ transport system ATPase subunit
MGVNDLAIHFIARILAEEPDLMASLLDEPCQGLLVIDNIS